MVSKIGRAALRGVKWVLIAGLSIIALALACWFGLPDEALVPEAQKILEVQPAVAPEMNAYYLLWGIRASPELDAFAVGKKIVDAQVAATQGQPSDATVDVEAFLGRTPYARRTPGGVICKARGETVNCVAALRAQRDVLKQEMVAKESYLRRYHAMQRFTQLEETMPPTFSVPMLPWQSIMEMAELANAAIAFDMEVPARRAAALAQLQADMAWWRSMGTQAGSIANRMIMASLLQRKYQMLSELLAEYPAIATEHREVVLKLTEPLTARETDLRTALVGEFRLTAAALRDAERQAATGPSLSTFYVGARMFKPNATTNLLFEHYRTAGDLYARSAAEIQAGTATFIASRYQFSYFDPMWWLYNPIGKIMVSVLSPQIFEDYSARLHDLEGYTRLIVLQRLIATTPKAVEALPAFLAGVDVSLRDPYTGDAMAYDPSTHSLWFTARSSNYAKGGGRVSVYLSRYPVQ